MGQIDGSQVMRCPNCGGTQVRASTSQGFLDQLLARISVMPFRCRVCQYRFRLRVDKPEHTVSAADQ